MSELLVMEVARIHGGPDALGVPQFDFSTNSNACGPFPAALVAVQQADATRYPDASYTALRAQLAAFHGVDVRRVVLAGSASEFIFRITAWVARRTHGQSAAVRVPPHAYGDYAHAARAWGLAVHTTDTQAQLVWSCDPSSPQGLSEPVPLWDAASTVVLDRAYTPMRLSGAAVWSDVALAKVWQMFSPNKSLGLTGVRAAYAIAPQSTQGEEAACQLEAMAPSWVVGAHGVAMLTMWTQADTQAWLRESLLTLAAWKQQLTLTLLDLGWEVQPSDTPYMCARPPEGLDGAALASALRAQGIKLRDTSSFALPGWFRLGALPPAAHRALAQAFAAHCASLSTLRK